MRASAGRSKVSNSSANSPGDSRGARREVPGHRARGRTKYAHVLVAHPVPAILADAQPTAPPGGSGARETHRGFHPSSATGAVPTTSGSLARDPSRAVTASAQAARRVSPVATLSDRDADLIRDHDADRAARELLHPERGAGLDDRGLVMYEPFAGL